MKKITHLYKNGNKYQVGEVTTADLSAVEAKIPTNNNQLENGAGYITSAALAGLASETYVQQEIGKIDKEIFVFADALPTENIDTNKIYVVPTEGTTGTNNSYTEYLYKDNAWEKIGEFKADQDLSNIYTKSETYSKTEVDGLIASVSKTVYLTQADYDALETKDATTDYYIYKEVAD